MSGKLSGNGIWESSRFIVPEFREALLRRQRENVRRERPQLDEMVWDEISRSLQESLEDRKALTLELFDPFERREVTGVVVDIDMIGQRVRLQQDNERCWIRVEDIFGVLS
ncbi:YolD-like family protein [Paenibacillus melissococcoides]|uniref:YolD-like family protein n=1 Tax=Paenibacillus melissococcoides TaxID=2912268 RepID=A0ABN8U4Q3_9BACL|nr:MULTISPECIES: YolD-like family protein [Paenibacillus]MEB9893261.1 YolD-like family protein [Bacillus cereus]CAH8246066.1 YolD-like family protein [Paenibacillus melissococcoides]CAH8712874.1 YolD-like family protein [Paenibacillus melissococcoides]CAH8713640.1 YolD-like family protein [Paenibacillus melissococcoides]GIO78739.1 hypothetical protein J6TS7_23490 [Paenibacillus dendritiformis]